jgi:hypothetical protein
LYVRSHSLHSLSSSLSSLALVSLTIFFALFTRSRFTHSLHVFSSLAIFTHSLRSRDIFITWLLSSHVKMKVPGPSCGVTARSGRLWRGSRRRSLCVLRSHDCQAHCVGRHSSCSAGSHDCSTAGLPHRRAQDQRAVCC